MVLTDRVPPIFTGINTNTTTTREMRDRQQPLDYRDGDRTSILNNHDYRGNKTSIFIAMKTWINTGRGWLYSLAFRQRSSRGQMAHHHKRRLNTTTTVNDSLSSYSYQSCHEQVLEETPQLLPGEDCRQYRKQQRVPSQYHQVLEDQHHHRKRSPSRDEKYRTEKNNHTIGSSRKNTKNPTTITTTTTTRATSTIMSTTSTASTMFPPLVLMVLLASTVFRIAEACSSRSTPKPRPPSPTLRPNITFQTYDCPEAYAKWYCLNHATCFSVRIGESILYNCECADGYMGQRCEFKDLDGSYLPNRERVMIETASIAGGVTILVFLIVILSVFACIYFRRKEKLKRMPSDLSQSELDRKPFNTRISCKNPAHLVNARDPELGRGFAFTHLASSNAHAATAASELLGNNNGKNGSAT